ncbi:hypothetical protein MLD38_025128 [Melastoma candidum]|uniref:Uncharacterized protein n=1 Tax=Melastoma candidum TaxID=119954 RepID=A0ACB9NVD4_9MYRT|nr:hypothetical protein MLD38_025128 [Melastoma candidum]
MWTRLVANKVFRRTIGSNNFVADFPSTDKMSLEQWSEGGEDYDRESFFHPRKNMNNYRMFVSTWNVGGIEPEEDLAKMEELFDTSNGYCDIYVLGFQEIVPLKASNVLGPDNTDTCRKWNSLIRRTLNKNCSFDAYTFGNSSDKAEDSSKRRNGIVGQEFCCLISKQMVGILITVWVRSNLRPYVRYPSVSCVGCGIMGCLGNKGSVSVRFQLHETSFCFICAHLTSGSKEGDEQCRTSNMAEIMSRTSFPRGPSLSLPKKILDHDRVILLGDLNYRISLPEAVIRELVDREDWGSLLAKDQLIAELIDGHVFQGWYEGPINFPPTYKYVPNSDTYHGCFQAKSSEKKRAPAWCDRIIWYGIGLKQSCYGRGESKLSDHRPVKAVFNVEVNVPRGRLHSHKNLFLSERYDQIPSDLVDEGSSRDELEYKARPSFMI